LLHSESEDDKTWYRKTYGVAKGDAWTARTDPDFVAKIAWHSGMDNIIKNQQKF
jgi:hypothetical protein